MHLLLRICDKLLTNLIDDAKSADDKNEVLGLKSNNLNELVEKIRDCGVSFCTWTLKGSKEELDWTSLSGSDYKNLLEKLPWKIFFSIHHNTHSKTDKLWEDFLPLYRFITHDEETKTIEFVFSKYKEWVNSFLDLGSSTRIVHPTYIV